MMYDLSHLFNSETVEVKEPTTGTVLFEVVVREITQGEKTEAQKQMFKSMNINLNGGDQQRKQELRRAMNEMMQSGGMMETSEYEEVAAIESWTLTDADGDDVPVCVEAWRALPTKYAQQIETVIERLNPSLDDEFQG